MFHETRRESVVGVLPALIALCLVAYPPLAAARTTCPAAVGSGPAAPAVVQGQVSNGTGGSGINGALIQLRAGKNSMTGTTDLEGHYAFELPLKIRGTTPQTVTVSTQANTYRTPRPQKLSVCPGKTYQANFPLQPVAPNRVATVKGQVVDSKTGKGIPNAIIAILIHRIPIANLSGETDASGRYSIAGVGFGGGLTIAVSTTAPPCVKPTSHPFSVQQSSVTVNFKLPTLSTGRLRCGGITGPETEPEVAPPTIGQRDSRAIAPELADDPAIQWGITTGDAILVDSNNDDWNSGHINDILKVGSSQALVASDTGGVWSVAWTSSSAAAIPVSSNWGAIDMTSLAQGPDGNQHVYAGTYTGDSASPGGVLWETDTSSNFPLVNWLQDNPAPPCGTIQHVLAISQFRRVVVACDSGIFWSPIPPAPAAHGIYKWEAARPGPGLTAADLKRQFARLAMGPGWGNPGSVPTEGTIAASAWGGTLPSSLIFFGGWKNGHLVLNAAQVAQPGNLSPARTSIASCAADQHMMYAVAEDPNSNPPSLIGAVWQSSDGGQNWSVVNSPGANAGNQGWYNQAIAVSPAFCDTFAIGWREAAFVSFDGGNSYTRLDNGGALHGDYHAVLFDPDVPTTLFMGNDGGLASATGVLNKASPTFQTYYNQHITDLQFYHGSPSYRTVGLVAGPLQDNGVAWTTAGGVWTRIVDSDGEYSEFSSVGPTGGPAGGPDDNGDVLAYSGNADNKGQWAQAIWNGASMTSPGQPIIPVTDSNNPRDPAGIPGNGSPAANIRHPNYTNSAGQAMYVVSGRGQLLWGAFANTDGTDIHWESLGSIGGGQNVTAVASANGDEVFVGTDLGNIYEFPQPYPSTGTQLAINEPNGGTGSINSLLEFFPTIAYAATGNRGPDGPGYVLTFLGQSWNAASGLPSSIPFASVEGADLGLIFAANSAQVFDSRDGGNTWKTASDGLPSVAHVSELHYVLQPDSNAYLYLASYGWSMLRAPLQ